MSIRKQIIKSVFSNWLGYVVIVALFFFITPFIVHTLGNEQYGIWSLVITLTGYYSLLKLGIRSAVTKYVAEFNAKDDSDSINRIVNTALLSFAIMGVVVLIVSYTISSFFTEIFKLDFNDYEVIRLVVILIGIDIAIVFVFQVFEAIIIAYKRFDVSNSIGVITTAMKLLLIFFYLKLGYGLVAMAAITLCVDSVASIVTTFFAFRLCKELSIGPKWISLTTFKKIYGFGSFNFMRHISRIVSERTGAIVIGIFLGMEQVAIYTIAEGLIRWGRTISKGIDSVMLPLSSELDAQGKKDNIKKLILTIPKYELLIALFLGIIFIVMGKDFIRLWMGPGYEMSYVILCLLMVPRFGMMSHESLIMILVGMGKNKFFGIIALFGSFTIVILSVLLAKRFGIIGVALGSLIPLTITYGIVIPIYSFRVLGLSLTKYIKKTILPPLYSAFVPLFLAYYMITFIKPSSLLFFFSEVAVVGIAIAICGFYFCIDDFIKSTLFEYVPLTKKLIPDK